MSLLHEGPRFRREVRGEFSYNLVEEFSVLKIHAEKGV